MEGLREQGQHLGARGTPDHLLLPASVLEEQEQGQEAVKGAEGAGGTCDQAAGGGVARAA